jgi:hypothetical protein
VCALVISARQSELFFNGLLVPAAVRHFDDDRHGGVAGRAASE